MKISPFTPLFFDEASPSDGLPSRWVQVWSPSDEIMIQVFASPGEAVPAAAIISAHSGATVSAITWQSWEMNADKVMYFFIIKGLTPGHYRVTIGGHVSEEFIVTVDESLLSRTSLIQYRFKDNRQREDVVSVIDHMPYFFDFRVPGGFKDSGWQFGVSNEQFVTQREDVVELFAMDYTMKTLTVGGPEGVPVWYGEMLNRLLTCSYVYVERVRYSRNDSEAPSMSTLVEGLDSFVFTQVLRKAVLLDPEIEELNQVALRRVDNTDYRSTDENTNRLIY